MKKTYTGLQLSEPLLWEKGKKGRHAFDLPGRDVEPAPLDQSLVGDGPDFPDLSEVEVVRHFVRLSTWNYGVDSGTYPLGSCTMKYNPKTNERQASLTGFNNAHPLLPAELSQGALRMLYEMQEYLGEITGMDGVTLQPAAGAHGEMTGMMMIHAYHAAHGRQRTKVIIPDTAHGTNPATTVLCGYAPVNVTSNEKGYLSPETIEAVMDEDTAGIMVTNPNTLGLYEENFKKIAEIVHSKGGLVYYDGANMNAIMGVVRPGDVGADVMHLNLHKTFSTPHGGGGPGSGPVAVKKDLVPFLPVPQVVLEDGVYRLKDDCPQSIGQVQPFCGSFNVILKAYAYIRTMGPQLKLASQLAVLNANYIKESLKGTLHLEYDRPCMHECVFDDKFQEQYHVTTMDMSKRLLDYGFHPPTNYFPLVVHGAIMIEPTETESKEDLDEFIAAYKAIAEEAKTNPELLHDAPRNTKWRRLDETSAARKPCLTG